MRPILEKFGPRLREPQFTSLDPLGRAEFRDRLFLEAMAADPAQAGHATWPAARRDEVYREFSRQLDALYPEAFRVAAGPPVKKRIGGDRDGFGVRAPAYEYEETPRRPVLDVAGERFLQAVHAGRVDPARFDKPALLGAGELVAAYAPERAGPWRARAEALAQEEFLPRSDAAAPYVASAALGAGGALAPATALTDWIARKTGLRKPDEPLFQESFRALNPGNQRLLTLAYPELAGARKAGAGLAIAGLGLGTARALEAAGIPLLSRTGLAADAAASAATGAAYADDAPGAIASLAGKPDSKALNALEGGLLSGAAGLLMREAAKTRALAAAREAYQFKGTDAELVDYLRAVKDAMPQPPRPPRNVTGTGRKVGTAEARPAAVEVVAPERPAPPPIAKPPRAGGPEFVVRLPDDPDAVVKGEWRLAEAEGLMTRRDLDPAAFARESVGRPPLAALTRTLQPERLGDSLTSDQGAPIVNGSAEVLSGSRRTEAIRAAYAARSPAAEAYRAWATAEAEKLGLPRERAAAMERPMLVRRATDLGGLSEEALARRSNPRPWGPTPWLVASERAMADARTLGREYDLMERLQAGDMDHRAWVDAAAARLMRAERLPPTPSARALAATRVGNALLATVVGPDNRPLVTALFGGTTGLKPIAAGLKAAAPDILRLAGGAFDIRPALEEMLRAYSQPGNSGILVRSDRRGQSEGKLLHQTLGSTLSSDGIAEFFKRYRQIAQETFPASSRSQVIRQARLPRHGATEMAVPGQDSHDHEGGLAALGHRYALPKEKEKINAIRALARKIYDTYKPRFRGKTNRGVPTMSRSNPNIQLFGLTHPQDLSISLFHGRNYATVVEELLHVEQIANTDWEGKWSSDIKDSVKQRWEKEVHQKMLDMGFIIIP